jgi:hypothetical protein
MDQKHEFFHVVFASIKLTQQTPVGWMIDGLIGIMS